MYLKNWEKFYDRRQSVVFYGLMRTACIQRVSNAVSNMLFIRSLWLKYAEISRSTCGVDCAPCMCDWDKPRSKKSVCSTCA